MALYSQLSDELEQTNRGVVALYAELDEKSERLRVASESKDRFWANVSHELRTPLNSIIGLAGLLAESDAESALQSEQLYQVQLIRNSGGTLLALVNDLLDVAKAESGQLRIDPAEVDLPALLTRMRSLVRPMADTSQVSLIVDSENAPPTVLTDELALTAILRNLLSNAIKYTSAGEVRLTVSAARRERGDHGRRHRHGHPRGASGPRIRGVLPGAGRPPRRYRTRPALCPAAGGDPRRRADAHQRARHRHHRRAAAAPRVRDRRYGARG